MTLAEHAALFPGDPNKIDQLGDVLSLETKRARAKWLGERSVLWGMPPELPILCTLVEAEMKNLPYLGERNDYDSVGPYQQRDAYGTRAQRNNWVWATDAFLREAWRVRAGNIGTGDAGLGEWVADAQRPAVQYRGRYQQRLWEARELLEVEQMIEVTAAKFEATNAGSGIVNIRKEPSVASADVGDVPAGGVVQCDGYTTGGQLYGGTTTWLRLAGGKGWVTHALMRATLPPTYEQVAAHLADARATVAAQDVKIEELVQRFYLLQQKHAELVNKLYDTQVQRPGEIITAAQAVGL